MEDHPITAQIHLVANCLDAGVGTACGRVGQPFIRNQRADMLELLTGRMDIDAPSKRGDEFVRAA